MKKNFEAPIVKVITFEAQDVLAAAGSSEANAGGSSGGDFWSGCW